MILYLYGVYVHVHDSSANAVQPGQQREAGSGSPAIPSAFIGRWLCCHFLELYALAGYDTCEERQLLALAAALRENFGLFDAHTGRQWASSKAPPCSAAAPIRIPRGATGSTLSTR